MNRTALTIALLAIGGICAVAQEHAAQGLVLRADAAHRRLVVSCDPIPGYMDAMEMAFSVRDPNQLAGLKPGSLIRFTMANRDRSLYADDIHLVENFEPEPAEAGSLSALAPAPEAVGIGRPVPDFTLTDQAGQAVRLSQFRGQVVALTFGYSRCPNPNYCLRLSRNLAQVERRFHDRAGHDLVLVTIAIDPEYDQGAALARYAKSFGAEAASWHFLTGTVAQVHQVAGLFGMNFWNTGGLITHTLHTVVIDRSGRLAANIEGNQFSANQLGDLVQSVMERHDQAGQPRVPPLQ